MIEFFLWFIAGAASCWFLSLFIDPLVDWTMDTLASVGVLVDVLWWGTVDRVKRTWRGLRR